MSIGEKRGWISSPPGSSSGSGISLSTPCPWGFLCWSTLRTTGHRSSQWCAGRQGTEMRKAQTTPHCHFHSPPHHQLVHPGPWKQWLVCKRSLQMCVAWMSDQIRTAGLQVQALWHVRKLSAIGEPKETQWKWPQWLFCQLPLPPDVTETAH